MKPSFEQILKRYAPLLSRVAATYEANDSLKQELYQEICIAIWQALSRFNGDSNLKTYILRVAHNRGVSHISKEMKTTKAAREDDAASDAIDISTIEDSLEKSVSNSRQLEKLLHMIRELSLSNRQVFTLAMEGLSYQEIADITGLSPNNIGVMISRIRQSLKEQLDEK